MTNAPDLALRVVKRQSGTKPRKVPKVPASYGRMLVQRAATELGMTRKQFATAAGMDDQTARRLEAGEPEGSVKAAFRLRVVLVERGLDVPPVPVGELDWTPPASTSRPVRAINEEAETLRKNLIEARDALKFDLHDVNSLTQIPLKTLQAYELGDAEVSGAHLKALAKVFGYKMDELTEGNLPPPDPAARKVVHMRTEPGALELLSPEEQEQLARLRREAEALNAAARERMAKSKRR